VIHSEMLELAICVGQEVVIVVSVFWIRNTILFRMEFMMILT